MCLDSETLRDSGNSCAINACDALLGDLARVALSVRKNSIQGISFKLDRTICAVLGLEVGGGCCAVCGWTVNAWSVMVGEYPGEEIRR